MGSIGRKSITVFSSASALPAPDQQVLVSIFLLFPDLESLSRHLFEHIECGHIGRIGLTGRHGIRHLLHQIHVGHLYISLRIGIRVLRIIDELKVRGVLHNFSYPNASRGAGGYSWSDIVEGLRRYGAEAESDE